MFDLNQSEQSPSILARAGDDPGLDSVSEFRRKIDSNSPQPVLAYLFIGLNIAYFLVMLMGGVNLNKPHAASLLSWGANYGPMTVTLGQWWRLLTSMFIHIGILHLAFNMFVLYKAGPFMETLLGYQRFLIVYLVSGLAGGFASLMVHPLAVSAGASGAVFGLYGALVAILLVRNQHIPPEVLSPLTRGALSFLVINLVYGLAQPGIDISAHIGGLAGGFACGYFISNPLTLEGLPPRRRVYGTVAGIAALLFIGTALLLPRPADLLAELKQFGSIETKALADYKAAVTEARGKILGNAQLADRIDREVLVPWDAEHRHLAAMKRTPAAGTRPGLAAPEIHGGPAAGLGHVRFRLPRQERAEAAGGRPEADRGPEVRSRVEEAATLSAGRFHLNRPQPPSSLQKPPPP